MRGPVRRDFSPDIPDDLLEQLESIWTAELTGPAVAGENRMLIWTIGGDLVLLKLDCDTAGCEVVADLRPFVEATLDSTPHPAIVGEPFYLRDNRELRCLRQSP